MVEEQDVSGLNVLLVEDNDLNREIATAILEDMDISVTCAKNGKEAVDLFTQSKSKEYDLILMDLMMPVMNGYDACRKIRNSSHPDAQIIPIIAMTANAFVEDAQKCIQAGMNAHLAKPIEVNKLKKELSLIKEGKNL